MSGDDQGNLFVPRDLLAMYFGKTPRLLRAFERQALAVQANSDAIENGVAATGAIQDASVVTLSPNDSFTNEYLLGNGDGTKVTVTTGGVKIDVDNASVARVLDANQVNFRAPSNVTLFLPPTGTLLSTTQVTNINAASDSAAASQGVPIGGIYHNAGALRIRLV